MNKRSENTRKMVRTVLSVMTTQPNAWKATLGIADVLTELETYADRIDISQQKLDTPIRPWTLERRALRLIVGDLALTVATQLRAYAEKHDLGEVFLNAAVRATPLRRGPQTQTLSEAERLIGVATPYAAVFVPTEAGGINRLEQLIAETAAYRQAVVGKRLREVARSDGVRGVHTNALGASTLLAKLDRLLQPYRKENPSFYAAYKQARKRQATAVSNASAEVVSEATLPAKAA